MKITPRVTFLQLRKEIDAAMQAGFARQAIYDELRERLGMSYPTFCRYVNALIESDSRAASPRSNKRNGSSSLPQAVVSPSPPSLPKDTSDAERDGPPAAPAGGQQSGFRLPNLTEEWVKTRLGPANK